MTSILVVDNAAIIRTVLCRVLVPAGHTTLLAADGQEALALAQNEPVDLLITDVYMPGISGLELIRRFRQLHPAVPVLAISAGAPGEGYDALKVALDLGASRALAKPFVPKDLLDAVNDLLGQPTTKH